MTSGERKCWNITILDDSISEQPHAGVKAFGISLYRYSFGTAYATVYIADNDGGTYV